MTEQNTIKRFTKEEINFVKAFFSEELSRKGSKFFDEGDFLRLWVGEDRIIAIRKHANGGYWAKYRDEVGGYSSGDVEKLDLKDACETARARYMERRNKAEGATEIKKDVPESCQACKFYHYKGHYMDGEEQGECWKHAPVLSKCEDGDYIQMQVTVRASCICGDFQAK